VYRKFFGLTDYPFNDNPDPRFFCRTPEVDEAFNSLMLGVRERKGLILLTGEVGTGKTTLLKALVERLDENLYRSAFIFDTPLNTIQLLDFIMSGFGIEHDMVDKAHMLMSLKHWLLEGAKKGLTAILVIDEAQNLPVPVLEEVRLLNNLETPAQKLLQIVLAGQPELEEKLTRPELRQFRYRLSHWCRTGALDLPQTNSYVGFRLRVAGGDIEHIFASDAVAHVYRFTRGVPRLINLLCTYSMISAYADQEKPVSSETVQALARQLELDLNAFPFRPLPAFSPPSGSAPAALPALPPIEGEKADSVSPEIATNGAEAGAAASSEGGEILPSHLPPPSPPVSDGRSLNIIRPPVKRPSRLMTPVAWAVLLLLMSGIVLGAFYRAHEKTIAGKILDANAHAVTRPNATDSAGPGISTSPGHAIEATVGQPPPTLAPVRPSPEISKRTGPPSEQPEPPRFAPIKAQPNPPPAALSRPNRRITEANPAAKPASTPAPRQLVAPVVGQIEVTSDVSGTQVAIPSSEVTILTTPPGAEIAIDRKQYGLSPVHTTLTPGEHTYSVSHAGFEPLTGTLILHDQDNVTKKIELHSVAPKLSGPNVQLATTPPGSAVYVDGAPLSGVTPTTFRLSPGAHTVIFFLAGHRPVRREVNVPAEGVIAISETLSPQ
jgi:general secretion pathway protein A